MHPGVTLMTGNLTTLSHQYVCLPLGSSDPLLGGSFKVTQAQVRGCDAQERQERGCSVDSSGVLTPHPGRLAASQSDLIWLSDLMSRRALVRKGLQTSDHHTQHDAVTVKAVTLVQLRVCVCMCGMYACVCGVCVCVKTSLFLAGRILDLYIPYFVHSCYWMGFVQ